MKKAIINLYIARSLGCGTTQIAVIAATTPDEALQLIVAERGYRVDFNQALDARLVTDEFAERLAKIKWLYSCIRFGCDTTAQIAQCQRAMDLIHSYGF